MKRSQRVYLGVDMGASSGRAVLGVLQDNRLKIEDNQPFSQRALSTRRAVVLGFSVPVEQHSPGDAAMRRTGLRPAVGRGSGHMGRGFRPFGRRWASVGRSDVLSRPHDRRRPALDQLGDRRRGTLPPDRIAFFTGVRLVAIDGARPWTCGRQAEIGPNSADDVGPVSPCSLRSQGD